MDDNEGQPIKTGDVPAPVVTTDPKVSPKYSFKGYSFVEALARNLDAVKVLLAVIGAYTTYMDATGTFNWAAFGMAFGGATAYLAYKLLLDAMHFFFKDVALQ